MWSGSTYHTEYFRGTRHYTRHPAGVASMLSTVCSTTGLILGNARHFEFFFFGCRSVSIGPHESFSQPKTKTRPIISRDKIENLGKFPRYDFRDIIQFFISNSGKFKFEQPQVKDLSRWDRPRFSSTVQTRGYCIFVGPHTVSSELQTLHYWRACIVNLCIDYRICCCNF